MTRQFSTDKREQERKQWLETKNRPLEYKTWIGRGRDYTPMMKVDSTFPDHSREWWKTLQPEWRKATDTWPMAREIPSGVDEDWATLARGGKNGFGMVLVGLVWWYSFAQDEETSTATDELESAIEDVKWVMAQIVDGLTKGGPVLQSAIGRSGTAQKRGADEEMPGSAKKKSVRFLLVLGKRLHADSRLSTERERVGNDEGVKMLMTGLIV